ncbi:MAG: enoyl-CoA hydratase [Sphingomicrobium sp.]
MPEAVAAESEIRPQLIGRERAGAVLRLTLRNPPANALSIAVIEALQAELDAARDDEGVRVIVLAAGGSLFSGGHDLKEMTSHRGDADRGRGFFEQTFAQCARLMRSIVDLPRPIIAEVDGIATAAGCQLVASCDLAIASDRSRFAVNGIDVGLFCATPAVALTRNIGAKRAMDMLLTGAMIDATTALDYGLVNRVVPSAELSDAVTAQAELIAAKSPVAVRLGKQAVRRQAGMNLADAYELTSRAMVEDLLSGDAEEGISAFLEKRPPVWPGDS